MGTIIHFTTLKSAALQPYTLQGCDSLRKLRNITSSVKTEEIDQESTDGNVKVEKKVTATQKVKRKPTPV